ncbi:MAG: hypothetical protein DRJ49_06735 [Thermoprotei archaeon]|nr:MAG: hypothetical protein DRJ49_06735 [Thermoprotei archaeon]
MLEAIQIRNFKSLKDASVNGLSKLNVFIGPNNAGKSSILHAIALIAQSIGRDMRYKGDFIDLERFRNIVYMHDENREIDLSLRFRLAADESEKLSKIARGSPYEKLDFSSLSYSLRIVKGNIKMQYLKLSDDTVLCKVFFKEGYSYAKLAYLEKLYRINVGGYNQVLGPEKMVGWRIGKIEEVPNAFNLINTICEIIGQKLSKIYYFSVSRRIDSREESIAAPERILPMGRDAPAFLHWVYSNRRQVFFDKIVRWAREFGIKDITSGIVENRTYIGFIDSKLDVEVNVVDSGFGLNQLIMIVAQCFVAEPGSIIMIEEPEIHLHKMSQYKMIDMFREVANEGKQVIMTTHSDLIFFRLWRLVRDGKLSERDVSVYYVDKTTEGTKVEKVNLREHINKLRKEYQEILGALRE